MAKLTSTAGAPFWLGVATLTKVLLFAGRRPTTGLVLVALVACWLSLAREASARVVSFFVSSKLVSSNRPAPRSSSSWEEVASPIKFSNLYCELCQGTSQPTKSALEWVQCSLRTKEGETEADLRNKHILQFAEWEGGKRATRAICNLSLNGQLSRTVGKLCQRLPTSVQLLWKLSLHLFLFLPPLQSPFAGCWR